MNGVLGMLQGLYVADDMRDHAELGEVHQVRVDCVRSALLDEHQVHQVHTQVRNYGRITLVLKYLAFFLKWIFA